MSSPIEFADGLQDHLLIAHGMIDDNVFFRDSVMLTQKLIELRKDKWDTRAVPAGAPRFHASGQLVRRVPPHPGIVRRDAAAGALSAGAADPRGTR